MVIRTVRLSESMRRLVLIGMIDRLQLNSVTVRLFKNEFTPPVNAVAANFVQCDFPGYAAIGPLTFLRIIRLANATGFGVVFTDLVYFFALTMTTPQTAYGYYVTDSSTGVLLAWGVFDVPFTFSASEDTIAFPLKISLPTNF